MKTTTHTIRILILFLMIGLIHPQLSVSQITPDDVLDAERERYEAMISLEMEQLKSLLAGEFTYHQPTGFVADKKGYLEQTGSGNPAFISYEFLETGVEAYESFAISKGIVSVQIMLDGTEQEAKLRYLNVWILRDERLQLAARQSAFVQ